MMLSEPLFYVPEPMADANVVLTGVEANHIRAQRLRPGDAIALFDGRGMLARGNVETSGRGEVRIAITESRRESPPLPRLDLYCAVPKGDRIAVLLDMATQLGMSRFVPVRWQRSVSEPGARAQERWRRVCIEACKQSRRLFVPEIAAPTELANATHAARESGALAVVGDPGGGAPPGSLPDIAKARPIALFIGPEGGATENEQEILREAGAVRVGIGDGVLRIETAAVALIAAVIAFRDRSD